MREQVTVIDLSEKSVAQTDCAVQHLSKIEKTLVRMHRSLQRLQHMSKIERSMHMHGFAQSGMDAVQKKLRSVTDQWGMLTQKVAGFVTTATAFITQPFGHQSAPVSQSRFATPGALAPQGVVMPQSTSAQTIVVVPQTPTQSGASTSWVQTGFGFVSDAYKFVTDMYKFYKDVAGVRNFFFGKPGLGGSSVINQIGIGRDIKRTALSPGATPRDLRWYSAATKGNLGKGVQFGASGWGGKALVAGGAAAKTLGVAGGIYGGATIIRGAGEFVHSFDARQFEDAGHATATRIAGGMRVGGTAAGALAGAALGAKIGSIVPGLGTLIGAGLGAGIGAWVSNRGADGVTARDLQRRIGAEQARWDDQEMQTAIAQWRRGEISEVEFEAVRQQAITRDLEGRFGNIRLSMREIQRLARNISFGDNAEGVARFADAAHRAAGSIQAMQAASNDFNYIRWRLTVDYDLDPQILLSFGKALVGSVRNALIDNEFELTMAMQLLLGNDADTTVIRDIFSGKHEKREEYSSKFLAAIESGDEEAIGRYKQNLLNLEQSEISSSFEGEVFRAQRAFRDSDGDYESFLAMMGLIELAAEEYKEAHRMARDSLVNFLVMHGREDLAETVMSAFDCRVEDLIQRIKNTGFEALESVYGLEEGAFTAGMEFSKAHGFTPLDWDPQHGGVHSDLRELFLNTDALQSRPFLGFEGVSEDIQIASANKMDRWAAQSPMLGARLRSGEDLELQTNWLVRDIDQQHNSASAIIARNDNIGTLERRNALEIYRQAFPLLRALGITTNDKIYSSTAAANLVDAYVREMWGLNPDGSDVISALFREPPMTEREFLRERENLHNNHPEFFRRYMHPLFIDQGFGSQNRIIPDRDENPEVYGLFMTNHRLFDFERYQYLRLREEFPAGTPQSDFLDSFGGMGQIPDNWSEVVEHVRNMSIGASPETVTPAPTTAYPPLPEITVEASVEAVIPAPTTAYPPLPEITVETSVEAVIPASTASAAVFSPAFSAGVPAGVTPLIPSPLNDRTRQSKPLVKKVDNSQEITVNVGGIKVTVNESRSPETTGNVILNMLNRSLERMFANSAGNIQPRPA